MYKILIAPTSFGKISSAPIDLLKKNNCELIFNDKGRKFTIEELIEYIKDCDGVIAGTESYNLEVLNSNNKLKAISRLGVGIDNIDIVELKKRRLSLFTTKTTPELAVAELTIGLMFDLLRKISKSNNNLKNNIWNKEMGSLLSHKTVGIIGLGKIGKKIIDLLNAFNIKFLVYDLDPDIEFCKMNKCKITNLDSLLKNSDIISIHTNSSKENSNLINKEKLKLMKTTSLFINTARGDLVDEKSLIDAIEKKQIYGAALDVFADEPYYGNLINFDNVILTPHIGAYAGEVRLKMEIEASENLIKFL